MPLPSCPWSLAPHVHTEVRAEMLLDSMATAESQPAAIPVTWDKPAILTGFELSVIVPLPSWPDPLTPQAHTVPSDRRARLDMTPAATWVIPVRPVTWPGTTWMAVLASPSWPYRLAPQAQTVPSDRTARLWSYPAATCTTSWPAPMSADRGLLLPVVSPSPSWP